ncbi:MAG: terpene cyclase/mutase family protein [Planctomycetaceae bacterium]|nr:terpene cyclase/mutase family protein [Planctomycetaceae bacterium]
MRRFGVLIATAACIIAATSVSEAASAKDPKIKASARKALDYLAREQKKQGYWEANGGQYRVAMTALSANAMLCEGSTMSRGRYAKNIELAVDWLIEQAQPSGLIGYKDDYHYTYGHGYSMLFLSQVYGDEENEERRAELRRILTKAVEFCGNAQTSRGGWGYVSAKEGNDFDEGSTCITQLQGLRACRNAGIPVPKKIIDDGKKYVFDCTIKTGEQAGAVQYSIKGGGGRPAITAAGLAGMFNAGEYEGDQVKMMLGYCEKNVWPGKNTAQFFGHWHYTHYYYAQVMYRLGGAKWEKYFRETSDEIIRKQSNDGSWKEGHVGPVYTTAMNATILQIDNGFLPIYQR